MLNQYGFWGPPEGIDSQDYMLFLEGSNYVARPDKLLGHTLTNPNVDQSDALTITRVRLSQGRLKTVVVTKRAPEERGRQYTIGFPSGSLWTPAMQAALRPGCRKTVYMKYLCPSDARYNHADIMPDALFDPPQPEGDLITVDDINPVAFTSVMRISEQFRIYTLGWSLIYDDATADRTYQSVEFLSVNCPGCADVPGLDFVIGGGDGTLGAVSLRTDDRLESAPDSLTTGAAVGNYIMSWFNDGTVIVAGSSDAADVATGTVGSLHVSRDGGSTFTTISGITAPILSIVRLGDSLLAAGGTGAGAPVLYKSDDNGKSWAAVTNTLVGGTDAFTDMAVDAEAGRCYIVGEGGTLLLAEISGTTLSLSDISGNLPASPGTLNAVAVLAKDFVAVAGAAGYYAESLDGGEEFTQLSVAGSTDIADIAGDRFRTVVAAGGDLYQRDLFTDYEFAVVELQNGLSVTGDYRAVKMRRDSFDNFNMFIAVTDDGEVVMGKSFLPNS